MNKKKFLAGATLAAFATTLVPVAAFAAENTATVVVAEDQTGVAAGSVRYTVTLNLATAVTDATTYDVKNGSTDLGDIVVAKDAKSGKGDVVVAKSATETTLSIMDRASTPVKVAEVKVAADDRLVMENAVISTTVSDVYVVEEVAEANTEKLVFDIDLKDSKRNPALKAGNDLYIWAERTSETVSDVDTLAVTTVQKDGTTDLVVDAATYPGMIVIDPANLDDAESNVLSVELSSAIAGDVVLKAAIATSNTNAVDGKGLIGSAEGTIEADSAKTDWNIDVDVKAATPTANGLDSYEVTVTVETDANDPVRDEEVTVSFDKSGASINKSELVTDARGQVKFEVTATKGQEYEMTVEAGKFETATPAKLDFTSTGAVDIDLIKEVEEVVAVDTTAEIKVAAYDLNGNKIGATSSNFGEGAGHSIKVEKVEVTYGDKEEKISVVGDKDDSEAFYADEDGNIGIRFTPAKEGKYDFRVSLSNGKTVKTSFEAKEQGDVVKMELNYETTTLALGATATPEIVLYDADGVKAVADEADSNFKFAANGKGFGGFEAKGEVKATTNDDYAGEKINVTVVDTKTGLSAAAELTVAAEATGLAFMNTEAQAGVTKNVTFSVVDAEGNKIALGDVTNIDATAVVVEKPEGAVVNVDVVDSKLADLEDKGLAVLQVTSNKEGVVKVNVIVEATKGSNTNYYTGIAEVTVGKEAVTASEVVTMFINSPAYMVGGETKTMDVAPFIQEGRTFLPVRTVAEAVGAEVEYDETTQVATFTKGDKVVTLTLGSNIMTVDGESVTMDAAAFSKDGRTVAPLRFVAEAFDCDVEAISAADGSTSGVILAVK